MDAGRAWGNSVVTVCPMSNQDGEKTASWLAKNAKFLGATIALAILGNGVYEHAFMPSVYGTKRLLLDLLTLGSESITDAVYYLSEDEEEELRSRFTSVEHKRDFQALHTEMEKTAKQHNRKLIKADLR